MWEQEREGNLNGSWWTIGGYVWSSWSVKNAQASNLSCHYSDFYSRRSSSFPGWRSEKLPSCFQQEEEKFDSCGIFSCGECSRMSEPRQDQYKNHPAKLCLCGKNKWLLFEVTKSWNGFSCSKKKPTCVLTSPLFESSGAWAFFDL